ncbi:MAG TPA: hypothetical protein DCM08_05420 [Microscillaceae bacterium]|jgi:Ca-activated chloride channel family protein|nr:hypothetical protein [Microscillaceae bacterium]
MNWEWLSWKWFTPETFWEYQWENILFLYLIAAIPLLFVLRWLLNIPYLRPVEVAFTANRWQNQPIAYLRHIPSVLFGIFTALVLIAAARPQKVNQQIEQSAEGIDILLALDVSESMLYEDFTPNRLEAAKKVAQEFITGRRFDRIGLILFAGKAYSLSPLTTDYDMLRNFIDEINSTTLAETGTAIGDALALAINRMRESQAKSKIVVLLSDGDSNAGSLDPLVASQLCSAYGLKVYTILVGMEGKVPYGKDESGSPKYFDNTVDETTLRQIADNTEAKFFRASNNQTLSAVFRQIDKLEKTEIKEKRFQTTQDFYDHYLVWALIFFLCWMFSKSLFITNITKD